MDCENVNKMQFQKIAQYALNTKFSDKVLLAFCRQPFQDIAFYITYIFFVFFCFLFCYVFFVLVFFQSDIDSLTRHILPSTQIDKAHPCYFEWSFTAFY